MHRKIETRLDSGTPSPLEQGHAKASEPSAAALSNCENCTREQVAANPAPAEARQLLLMRGLPSCGKTTRAKELVQDGGIAFEFDEYFYTQVGNDPARYDYSRARLDDAREWNVSRICAALDRKESPVVIDDDNGFGETTHRCVKHAVELGYAVDFREPTTPWWGEIRRLLGDKKTNNAALKTWAQKLTLLSRGTHRVPLDTFVRRIERWRDEISLNDILRLSLPSASKKLAAK